MIDWVGRSCGDGCVAHNLEIVSSKLCQRTRIMPNSKTLPMCQTTLWDRRLVPGNTNIMLILVRLELIESLQKKSQCSMPVSIGCKFLLVSFAQSSESVQGAECAAMSPTCRRHVAIL